MIAPLDAAEVEPPGRPELWFEWPDPVRPGS